MLENKEYVVLLHGIMRSSIHMKPIENMLKKNNYKVININYPSTQHNISTLSEFIWQKIKNVAEDNNKIHFVGYSMGGLVARSIIEKYNPKNLGRVVLIGTPNHGSEIADIFKNNFLYNKVFGPAGQELITKKGMINETDVSYELCSIGSVLKGAWKMLYPISYFLMKNQNDGRVSLQSTVVKGMKQHLIVSCPHFFMPYSKKVKSYIISFLKTGYVEVL